MQKVVLLGVQEGVKDPCGNVLDHEEQQLRLALADGLMYGVLPVYCGLKRIGLQQEFCMPYTTDLH